MPSAISLSESRRGSRVRRPCHREQLPHQAGRLHPGVADFLGILAHALAGLDVARSRSQYSSTPVSKIVEVVRHAAGQAADRFQPFGLPQALVGFVVPERSSSIASAESA